MGKKIIATDCAFQAHPNHPFGWDDVQLYWTAKPHRRKEARMICLLGRTAIESDLRLSLQCQKDHPEMDWADDIAHEQELLAEMEAKGIVIRLHTDQFDKVYLNKAWLTKNDADLMLREYAQVIGFPKARIKWQRSKCYAIPMTF